MEDTSEGGPGLKLAAKKTELSGTTNSVGGEVLKLPANETEEKEHTVLRSFAQEIKQAWIQSGMVAVPKQTLREIADRFGLEYLGSGRESVVVRQKGNMDTVFGVDFEDMDPETAKGLFYTHKILATMFPHNFPQFKIVGGKHPEKESNNSPSFSIRKNADVIKEEVTLDSNVVSGEINVTPLGNEVKHGFDKVKTVVEQLRLPVWFEGELFNLVLGKDGGIKYVDRVGFSPDVPWREKEIIQFMETSKNKDGTKTYQPKDISTVRLSLRRLHDLGLAEVELEDADI